MYYCREDAVIFRMSAGADAERRREPVMMSVTGVRVFAFCLSVGSSICTDHRPHTHDRPHTTRSIACLYTNNTPRFIPLSCSRT
jgi:hypothetical protein